MKYLVLILTACCMLASCKEKVYEAVPCVPATVYDVQVYVHGTLEVISGRHKFALALENGTESVICYVFNEDAQHDAKWARLLDFENNMRGDQADELTAAIYTRETGYDDATLRKKGLMRNKSKSKRGILIGREARQELWDRFINGAVSPMDAEIICTMTQGIRDKARVDEIQRRCCMLLEQGKSWEYISAMVQLMANKESVFMKQGLLDLGADFEADMERAATYVEKNVQKLTEAINVIKSGRRLSGEKKKLAERLGQFTTSSEASEALYTDLVDMRERFRNIGAYPDLVAAASMWDGKSELDPVEMARSYSRSAQEQAAAEANMTREEWEEAQAAKAAKQAAEEGTGSLFGSMSIREETRSKARELDALAQSCTPSLTTNSRRAVPLIKATPQAVEEAVNARRPEAEERWNEWLDEQKEYGDLTEQELADLVASKDESIEETLSEYEKEEQERLDIEALSEWDEKREEWAYETQELIADELRHRGYNVETDRSNISSSFYIAVTHPSDADGEHALKIRFSDHVDKHGGNDLNVGFGSVENMVEKAEQFAGRELPQVEGGGASFSKRYIPQSVNYSPSGKYRAVDDNVGLSRFLDDKIVPIEISYVEPEITATDKEDRQKQKKAIANAQEAEAKNYYTSVLSNGNDIIEGNPPIKGRLHAIGNTGMRVMVKHSNVGRDLAAKGIRGKRFAVFMSMETLISKAYHIGSVATEGRENQSTKRANRVEHTSTLERFGYPAIINKQYCFVWFTCYAKNNNQGVFIFHQFGVSATKSGRLPARLGNSSPVLRGAKPADHRLGDFLANVNTSVPLKIVQV